MIKNPISRIEVASAGGYLSYENIADKATVAGVEIEIRKNLFVRPVSNAAHGMNKLSLEMCIRDSFKATEYNLTVGHVSAIPSLDDFSLDDYYNQENYFPVSIISNKSAAPCKIVIF